MNILKRKSIVYLLWGRYAWSSLFFPTALVDISHGRLDLSPFASGNASKKLSGASTCHACAISIALQTALNENAAGINERTAVPGRLGEDLRSMFDADPKAKRHTSRSTKEIPQAFSWWISAKMWHLLSGITWLRLVSSGNTTQAGSEINCVWENRRRKPRLLPPNDGVCVYIHIR